MLLQTYSYFHTAAAPGPFPISDFLKKHEAEFFTVVNPKQSLLRLIRKGVITEGVKSNIDAADTKDALEILYDHLICHGSTDTLMQYCEMAIDATGLPNMQAFGRKMKEELQKGYYMHVHVHCVCVCVHVCMCACVCDLLHGSHVEYSHGLAVITLIIHLCQVNLCALHIPSTITQLLSGVIYLMAVLSCIALCIHSGYNLYI